MISISTPHHSSPLRLTAEAAPAASPSNLAKARSAGDRFALPKGRPVLDLASGRGNEKPAPPLGAGKDIIAAPEAGLDELPAPGPDAGTDVLGALPQEPGEDVVAKAEAEHFKKMSEEQKAQYLLEKEVQKQNQAAQLLSSLLKAKHDGIMSIIQKIG